MTLDILMVLAVLGGAIALFVTDWLRVDLVAVLVLLALALTGLVTPAQAVSGFSSPAAVTICGIFILSAGLQRTGVASSLGRWVEQLAGGSEGRLMVALMGTAAVLSFFMNTIAIVALFLPAVMDLSRRTGHAPSRLLMPLAFGALLGGLTTMFATLPNLLASTALKDAGLRPFGLFDFLPVGGAAALAGILYMVLVGRRFLPVRRLDPESALGGGVNLRDFYQLHERMFVLRLPPGSSLRNRTLEESLLGSALGLHVVGILRDGQTQLAPDRSTVLRDQDRLLIQGRPEQLDDLQAWRGLTLGEWAPGFQQWLSADVEFVEMRLAEQSRFLGQTPARFDARRAWGVNILAIRRGGEVRRSHLREWRLQAGDRLLAQAPRGRSSGLGELVGADEVRVLPLDVACSAYDLHARLFTLRVPSGSPLVGHALNRSRLGEALGFTVLALTREGQTISMPGPEQELSVEDTLLVLGRTGDLVVLQGLQDLQLECEVAPELAEFESEQLGLMEAVLSPRSRLAGQTLRQLRFRERYGLTVMGVWHAGEAVTTKLRDVKLQLGDAVLLYGLRDKLKLLAREPDFIVLTQAVQEPPLQAKAPLAAALDQSGAAAMLAGKLMDAMRGAGPSLVLAILFVATALAAGVMPSAALVVLMAPITLETAAGIGISPHAAMMTVALAASSAFNSPVSNPSNVLIMGPGGYRFIDFLKVGPPLTLVVLLVVLLVLPWFWPLTVP